MDFQFSIDFDAEMLDIIIDNSTKVRIFREDDGFGYSGFGKLTDTMSEKLKEIGQILFSLEEEC